MSDLDPPASPPESREMFEIIQREYHHLRMMISNRMTWCMISQSFLMAAFFASGAQDHAFWFARWFIPLLGIVTSLLTSCSMCDAIQKAERLEKYSADVFGDAMLQCIAMLLCIRKPDKWEKLGRSKPTLAMYLPLLFLLMWVLAWIFAYCESC